MANGHFSGTRRFEYSLHVCQQPWSSMGVRPLGYRLCLGSFPASWADMHKKGSGKGREEEEADGERGRSAALIQIYLSIVSGV